MKTTLIYTTSFFVFLILVASCTKKEDFINSPVALEISLSGEDIADRGEVFARGATWSAATEDESGAMLQAQTVSFNDDYSIVAELHEEDLSSSISHTMSNEQRTTTSKRAAIAPILREIKFILLVFDESGNYLNRKTYNVSASGAVTPEGDQPLTIIPGNYRFVAISRNTSVEPSIPTITEINGNLSYNSNQDLMFFNSGLIGIMAGSTNHLNIVLKHMFSQLSIRINSTATNGYNIHQVGQIVFSGTYPSATINLSNGALTPTGTMSNLASILQSNFTGLNTTETMTSTSYRLNNSTTSGSLTLSSLTVGLLVKNTPTTFNNIDIQPGHRYVLVLRIVPNVILDTYVNEGGIPAVRIGGKTWMLHNLGANRNRIVTGVVTGDLRDLFGSYYQWGRSVPVVQYNTSNSSFVFNGNWNPHPVLQDNAWNAGTDENPAVGQFDPCPTGWRVPTLREWADLHINGIQSYQGDLFAIGTNPWIAGPAVYTNAKVIRSKRDYNIKIVFPATGRYVTNNGAPTARGFNAPLFSSTIHVSGSTRTAFRTSYSRNTDLSIGSGGVLTDALPIRCVKDQE